MDYSVLKPIIDKVERKYFWFFTAKGEINELKDHNSDIQRFINSIYFN